VIALDRAGNVRKVHRMHGSATPSCSCNIHLCEGAHVLEWIQNHHSTLGRRARSWEILATGALDFNGAGPRVNIDAGVVTPNWSAGMWVYKTWKSRARRRR